jgi:hypothetical protein
MNTSEFYAAGLVEKGEEIAGLCKVTLVISDWQEKKGFLVLTNKKLLFVQRPSGLFSKGFDVLYSVGWNEVSSVSTSGWWFKTLNVTIRIKDTMTKLQFTLDGAEEIKDMITKRQFVSDTIEQTAKKIVLCKKNYVEPTTIEATKVVIEEANKDKDNAMVILQKRLAKGEITLEEFHKLVTRL